MSAKKPPPKKMTEAQAMAARKRAHDAIVGASKDVAKKPAKKPAPKAPAQASDPPKTVGGVRSLFANLPMGALFVWPGRPGVWVKYSPHFTRRLGTDMNAERGYLTQEEYALQMYHIPEDEAAEALAHISELHFATQG